MKILGLLRHAKSDWGDARSRDFDRPLNARGRQGADAIGAHIRDYCRHETKHWPGNLAGHMAGNWNRILASPAARCAETIERAARSASEFAAAKHDSTNVLAVNWDRRIYLASSATLIDVLRELDDTLGAVMMVGHNPGLEDLIFDLVSDDGSSPLRDVVEEKFPTATFAVLEMNITRWADLTERCAHLVHLMRPRDLNVALGPEMP